MPSRVCFGIGTDRTAALCQKPSIFRKLSTPQKQAVASGTNQRHNSGMKIGYCRVSPKDQNPDVQLRALKKAGCRTIYTDKDSGTFRKRVYLERCLKELQAGDVLVVWKLDRLSRSLRDLIALLDDLKTRGDAYRLF